MKKGQPKGQISFLIVLSLIPSFVLFAFTVNLGMLVHAKINLQNAADLAAYAGAATQARQLTHISHLNYQMRQVYKKFLFKYYVVGNRALRCFPRGNDQNCIQFGGQPPGDDEVFNWINPGGNSTFPGVPSVCISLDPTSNACQLAGNVPIIKTPDCFPLDPICGTLAQSTKQIENIQMRSCNANGKLNEELLTMWLYATSDNNDSVTQTNLVGLIQDLGLVPEELLLKERIETLQNEYINKPPVTVDERTISTLSQNPEQAEYERTILAYETARNNLNSNVFSQVTLQELQPRNMLELKTIYAGDENNPGFDAYYTKLDTPNSAPPAGAQIDPNNCVLRPYKLRANPPLGVKMENKGTSVFYAVKLTAKAKLLFNPFPFGNPEGSIDLVAYSAAAPFGSRIGPQTIDGSQFVTTSSTGLSYPTLVVSNPDQGTRMDFAKILRAHYLILTGGGNDAISNEDFNRGVQTALLPDTFEQGRYNIPVDVIYPGTTADADPNLNVVPYFRSRPANPQASYTFWAPLAKTPGDTGVIQLRDKIKGELNRNISVFQSQRTSASETLEFLLNKMDQYFQGLRSANKFNVAHVPNPLLQSARGPSIPDKVWEPNALATSFSTDHDYTYYSGGRDGYSVKFIPFNQIQAKIEASGTTKSDVAALNH